MIEKFEERQDIISKIANLATKKINQDLSTAKVKHRIQWRFNLFTSKTTLLIQKQQSHQETGTAWPLLQSSTMSAMKFA